MADERRKYPRYNISFPIECKRVNLPNYFYTVTKDLSLGGARVLSDDFLPKDEPFRVTLNLVKKVFNVKAKVAWCNQERYSDRYSAGLEFIDMPDSGKKLYSDFLEEVNN